MLDACGSNPRPVERFRGCPENAPEMLAKCDKFAFFRTILADWTLTRLRL